MQTCFIVLSRGLFLIRLSLHFGELKCQREPVREHAREHIRDHQRHIVRECVSESLAMSVSEIAEQRFNVSEWITCQEYHLHC